MYFDIIKKSSNKSSATWNIINQSLRKEKNTTNSPDMLINNELTADKRIIANEFNSYFLNITNSLAVPNNTNNNLQILDLCVP